VGMVLMNFQACRKICSYGKMFRLANVGTLLNLHLPMYMKVNVYRKIQA
jgi:hypothetical protein